MAQLIPDQVFGHLTRPQQESLIEALLDIAAVIDGDRPEIGRLQIQSLIELLLAIAAFRDWNCPEIGDLIEVLLRRADAFDEDPDLEPEPCLGCSSPGSQEIAEAEGADLE